MIVRDLFENGILDEQQKPIFEAYKKEHQKVFDLLYEYNKLCCKIINSYTGIEVTEEKLYIFPAFVEIHKIYQSAILMLEYGVPNSAENLLRSMFELMLKMLYVFKEENNIKRLKMKNYSEALSQILYIENNTLYEIVPKDYIDKYKTQLEESKNELIKQGVKNAPNIYDMCVELGLTAEYSYYKYLCDFTHTSFYLISSMNVEMENSVIINGYEDYDNVENIGLRIITILNIIVDKMVTMYFNSFLDEYNNLSKKLEKI